MFELYQHFRFAFLACCCSCIFFIVSDRIEADQPNTNICHILKVGYPIRPWTTQNASINLREDMPFASAFLKQLRRQAVLLAAREELGVLTRDAFLDETAPDGTPEIEDIDRFLIDHLGFVEGLFAQDIDYPVFLARLERLSRNELVTALSTLGLTRNDSAEIKIEKNEMPQHEKNEIEKKFYEYNIVSQFDTARRLHAAIQNYGETPEYLEMLVRAYTQLQILTNASFRDTHRVFQARAMLYAQRLVAKYGKNPETVSVRAAAWSLNNFHRLARNDFNSLPEEYSLNDWKRLARLYAEFDLPGLDAIIEMEKENPERKGAMLLKFILLTYTNNGRKTAAPYATSILQELIDCPRLYLNLFAYEDFFAPSLPNGTRLQEHWARQIPPSLREMDSVPKNISKAGQDLRKPFSGKSSTGLLGLFFGGGRRSDENSEVVDTSVSVETFYSELAALFQAMNSTAPTSDSEPSFQTLATLLQDEIFYAATLCALRQSGADTVITTAVPAVESHPLMNYLAQAYKDDKIREEFVQKFKKTQVPYELLSSVRLGFDFRNKGLWGQGKYMAPYLFGMRFGDRENVRDVFAYHQELRWQIGRNTPAFSVDLLVELCPNNPFTAAERIARKGTLEPDEADALFGKFGQYLNFRDAILAYYLKKGEKQKAISVLREMQKTDPGSNVWNQTMRLYLQDGNLDGAVQFLLELLENADEDHAWWRSEVLGMLGRILFLDGKTEEAAPYFDQLAQQSSYVGFPLKIRFLEASGQFDKALQASDLGIQNHFTDPYRSWPACYRMNSDRIFEITDNLFKAYEERRKQNQSNDSEQSQLYYISYCMGLPMQDLFGNDPSVRVFYEHSDPVAGFLAFFESLEKQDSSKSNALLRLLQDRGSLLGRGELAHVVSRAKISPGKGNPQIKKPVFRILAALFALDQQQEKPGLIDQDIIESVLRIGTTDSIRNDDALFVLYFFGRYFTAYGDREKGLECFRRICASRNLDTVWPLTFAVKEIRDAGREYADCIRTESNLPRTPADPTKIEEFSQRLFNLLHHAEAAKLTALSETESIFEVCRSDLPVTDIFPGGWTTWNFPQARLIRKLSGRSYYSAWSRDGKRIALGSEKYLAGVWNPENGDDFGGIRRTKEARGSSIAFTPDSVSVLFGGSDGYFGLWTPKSPGDAVPDWRKREHPWVSCVAITPDGKYFCTTTENDNDRGVFLWDMQTQNLIHTMKEHQKGINCAAFFSGGQRLVTVSRDKTAFIYNVRTGRPSRRLQGHKEQIRSVSVSPDDRIIATGSYDDTVMLWEAQTGEPIKTLGMFNGDVVSVAFSPNGTKLAVGRNHNGEATYILDTKTWEPIMIVPGHGFWNCQPSWSLDSRRLVTCGEDTRLWDISMDNGSAKAESGSAEELPNEILLKDINPKLCLIGSLTEPEFKSFRSDRKEFTDSLWAHAPSRVAYDLDGKWKTFKTSYGIRVGANTDQASCFFIVLGDGKILFRSELVADTLDRPLDIDVHGISTLELIVDPNRNNWNDHGVWYSPKLLK